MPHWPVFLVALTLTQAHVSGPDGPGSVRRARPPKERHSHPGAARRPQRRPLPDLSSRKRLRKNRDARRSIQPAGVCPPSTRLTVRPWVPWTVGVNAGVIWLALEMVKRRVGPRRCLVCNGPDQGPPELWGPDEAFRKALRASDTKRADMVSSILAFGVLPALSTGSVLLLRTDTWGRRFQDLSLVYESLALASLLQQITSMAVARRRPEATFHRVDGNQGPENCSFFSGHTTKAFSLAASATAILWIHKNPWTWLVAVLGFSAATAVGALRIAADKHYVSDVLTGALVGTTAGILIPRLSLRW